MNSYPSASTSTPAMTVKPPASALSHLILFLVLVALGGAVYFTPVMDWLSERQTLQARLAVFGWAAPWIFIGISALLTMLGAPRLLLCSLAGAAFGALEGLLWSQAGTLLGAYLTFLAVRQGGRDLVLRKFPGVEHFAGKITGRGLLAVLLIRQLPMNGFYNNLLLGLSPISHRHFLLGSLLGYLPLGFTSVLIGAGLMASDTAKTAGYALAAATAFVILGFGLKRLVRNKSTPVEDTDGSESRPTF